MYLILHNKNIEIRTSVEHFDEEYVSVQRIVDEIIGHIEVLTVKESSIASLGDVSDNLDDDGDDRDEDQSSE